MPWFYHFKCNPGNDMLKKVLPWLSASVNTKDGSFETEGHLNRRKWEKKMESEIAGTSVYCCCYQWLKSESKKLKYLDDGWENAEMKMRESEWVSEWVRERERERQKERKKIYFILEWDNESEAVKELLE